MLNIRNRSNFVSGWIVTIGFTLFVIGISDPLGTHVTQPGGGMNPFMIEVTVGSWLVTLGAYAFFVRPVLRVDNELLTIVNPFRTYVVDSKRITSVSNSGLYASVVVPGRKIRVAALEISLYERVAHGGALGDLRSIIDPTPGRHSASPKASGGSEPGPRVQSELPRSAEDGVSIRFTRPDLYMSTLTIIWILYLVAGVVTAAKTS